MSKFTKLDKGTRVSQASEQGEVLAKFANRIANHKADPTADLAKMLADGARGRTVASVRASDQSGMPQFLPSGVVDLTRCYSVSKDGTSRATPLVKIAALDDSVYGGEFDGGETAGDGSLSPSDIELGGEELAPDLEPEMDGEGEEELPEPGTDGLDIATSPELGMEPDLDLDTEEELPEPGTEGGDSDILGPEVTNAIYDMAGLGTDTAPEPEAAFASSKVEQAWLRRAAAQGIFS